MMINKLSNYIQDQSIRNCGLIVLSYLIYEPSCDCTNITNKKHIDHFKIQ